MWRFHRSALLPLCLIPSLAIADVVYVTDLEIFTYLAPCAASAVSANVQAQTFDHCPSGVTDLQACVCTKDNNFASISTKLSSSISYSCGGTATDDLASAETVLSAYCNQNSLPSFPTPTHPVSQYITDIAEFQYLAPCAASGLSYAIGTLTWDLCPPEATALASCACNKNQNSLLVSQYINSDVKYSCSSHSADITSAQQIFSGYCGMNNNGTSSFPTPTNPPGDMSYYITALPSFSALAPCAASAVSEVIQYQTWEYCPKGPQALASCACLKESVSGQISNSLTSSVKYSCSSTASADITSALAVFDFYCSAAKNLVKADGVTQTVSQSSPTGKTAPGTGVSTGPKATSTRGTNPAAATSGSSSGGSSGASSSGSPGGSGGSSSSSSSHTGVIVGAVVGVVAGLAVIGGIVWFFMWQARKRRAANQDLQPHMTGAPPPAYGGTGKPELAGHPVSAMPPPPASPNPSMMKHNNNVVNLNTLSPTSDGVSPVSAGGGPFAPPPPHGVELQGQAPAPYPPHMTELQGQNAYQQPGNQRLYGQPQGPGSGVHEFPGQDAVHQADSRPVGPNAELQGQGQGQGQGMGWHSGPVQQSYYEMDGGHSGYGQAR